MNNKCPCWCQARYTITELDEYSILDDAAVEGVRLTSHACFKCVWVNCLLVGISHRADELLSVVWSVKKFIVVTWRIKLTATLGILAILVHPMWIMHITLWMKDETMLRKNSMCKDVYAVFQGIKASLNNGLDSGRSYKDRQAGHTLI